MNTSNLVNPDGTPNLDAIEQTITDRTEAIKLAAERQAINRRIKTLNEYWTNSSAFQVRYILDELDELGMDKESLANERVIEMLKKFENVSWDSMRIGRRPDFGKLLFGLLTEPVIIYNEERDWFQFADSVFNYPTDRPAGVYEPYALETATGFPSVSTTLVSKLAKRIRSIWK